MVKSKGKRKGKAMDTGDESYNYAAKSTGLKKKRVVKLTRKQKLRKDKKIERGEMLTDRLSKKMEKDQRHLDNRIAAKAMW